VVKLPAHWSRKGHGPENKIGPAHWPGHQLGSEFLFPDDHLLRTIGTMRDVAVAVFRDHQNVMRAVTADPWEMVGNRDHGFHANHHAGFKHGVAILTQFKAGLAAIIVAQHTKAVAMAE
jgi:hypothetical protein